MRAKNKRIKYHFFDMQNECKNDNYDNIDNLMKNMTFVEEIFQFFCEEEKLVKYIKNKEEFLEQIV